MNIRPRPLSRSSSKHAGTLSPSRATGTSSAAWRCAAAALAIVALGSSTGCYEWKPIRALGIPGPKLDKQLQGNEVRYEYFSETVETEVVKAQTPYLEVQARRDPVTGKKRTETVDLRDLTAPEVKVVDRTGKIAAIIGGSTAGAVVIGLAIGLLVDGASKNRGHGTIDIDLGKLGGD